MFCFTPSKMDLVNSMKYILVLMLFISLDSCEKSNEQQKESKIPVESESDRSESLIERGAQTSVIDLNTYHQCWGTLIEGSEDALSFYAKNRSDCQKGTIVVAYEEFLKRENGKAIFNIADTMSIKLSEGNEAYLTTCNQYEERGTYFLLINGDLSNEYFKGVNKAWQGNIKSKKLVSIQPKNLRCLNMDYGAE